MNPTLKFCWVTRALDNKECMKALVLAKSLKRILTSGGLVILIGPEVHHELWEPLQQEFDTCIHLSPKQLLGIRDQITLSLYLKMYCWKLIKWSKVVYLDPNCMVVRNCDDIFESGPECGMLWTATGCTPSSTVETFMAKPCLNIWENFKKYFDPTVPLSDFECLKNLLRDERTCKLDENLILSVDLVKSVHLKNFDIQIVSFDGTHPTDMVDLTLGDTIEGRLLKMWDNLCFAMLSENLPILEIIRSSSPRLMEWMENSLKTMDCLQNYQRTSSDLSNSIAIVGISCRFPGANDLDEFWKLLMKGYDGISTVPEGRWTKEKYPGLNSEHLKSSAGFLKCKSDEFDGKFFGISPKELAYLDPQHRLTIQLSWEALEDAGIDPMSLHGTRAGVFAGAWRTDYRDILVSVSLGEEEGFRGYMGNSFGLISARISHLLGLTGPSISTESGCSGSIVAVDLAMKSLQRRESTLALACGVNLLNYPFTGIGMQGFVSADSHCKVFDARADGFGRAEGCGVLVLKRYADAKRDGDSIRGLLRGSAVAQEGESKSLGTPSKKCEALAMKLALKEANVDPKDVSYVEAHGTGTSVGDPLEVAAICEAYSSGRTEPLIIGSVKANIGHTESCSGIAGIIKVVLSMQNEMIPQHVNFQGLNPEIDLDSIPAQLPLTPIEWKRKGTDSPRIAGVSSFGVTGTDAHVIIQEPPLLVSNMSVIPELRKPNQIITLSGKTSGSLEQKISQYKQFLETTQPDIQDFSFTANCGRSHFPFRAVAVGKDRQEILRSLETLHKHQIPEEPPKLCFLFTGQGSQYPGMARSLYDSSFIFKLHFDRCDRILREKYSLSIKEIIWGSNSADLNRSLISQTSIFVVEYCLLMLWDSWGVKPDFVLGHSLGEFTAAVAAGILQFEDGLKLVVERSQLIDSLPNGMMLVVKSVSSEVEKLLKTAFNETERWLDFAAFNSNDQTVLAGSPENITFFSEFCVNNGIKTHILEATHAFHSRLMEPVLCEYRQTATNVNYSNQVCTFVSGMDGLIVEEDNYVNANYWVRHTRDSVRFAKASKAVIEKGCNLFLEIGPQPVLSALTMTNSLEMKELTTSIQCLPSLRKQNPDWSVILNSLGVLYTSGIEVNWKRFHMNEGSRKIRIPFYPFQNKSSWYQFSDDLPQEIHPLVGTPLSNATTTKIFHKVLKVQNVPFLKDHRIGERIIFPGAGFLEMCLVAGHAVTQCSEAAYFNPTAPITLENFVIEAPLGLTENEATQIQTVVTSEDSGDVRVTIYSKAVLDKETFSWIRHATATFSPIAFDESQRTGSGSDTFYDIKSRLVDEVNLNVDYDYLAEFGLKFGPTFRTLKKMWRHENEYLFQAVVTDDPKEYICHPVVSDAMLQAIMMGNNTGSNKLHVPFSVSKFNFYRTIPKDKQLFIYYALDDNSKQVKLYDSDGNLLANMMEAILLETTVSAVMSALSAQKIMLPKMCEEVWRTQMGCMDRRAENDKCFNMDDIRQITHQGIVRDAEVLSDEEKHFIKISDQLYGFYILKGFLDLGFKPQPGILYSVQDLAVQFSIKQSLLKYLRYLLMELEKEKYFQLVKSESTNSTFKCTKEFPTWQYIESQISQIYPKVHAMAPDEVEIIRKVTEKFADCITGRDTALSILFPDDPESTASLEAFYLGARFAAKNVVPQSIPELLRNCESHLQESGSTMRILEVGAGTGSFTKLLVPHLRNHPDRYEFTYTDLSPAFFQSGEKIFQNTNIKVIYKVLNIEQDSASQDFIPHYYDLIIANNVIHATIDVLASLRNLRNLLRSDGVILICETTSPFRAVNLAVGLLDDYWRFTDYDLRPHNCVMSLEKWKSALSSSGFDRTEGFTCYENRIGCVLGKADSSSDYIIPKLNPSEAENTSGWIIFGRKDCRVSQFFEKKLQSLGKKVELVTPAANDQLSSSQYSINPNQDTDVSDAFKAIQKHRKMKTDKVLYLWGLNSKNSNYSALTRPFLNICKTLLFELKPVIFVVTNRTVSAGESVLESPNASLLWSMTKSFTNEAPNSMCRSVDMDFVENSPTELEMEEVFSELFINDSELHVAYRNHERLVLRCVEGKFSGSPLSFPSRSDRFCLVLPTSKSIRDLKFTPAKKLPVGDRQIEIKVKSYALNFKDVLTVLKPSEEFMKYHTVGIDYSGVVLSVGPHVTNFQVGDAVFGFNMDGAAMPSHLVDNEKSIFKIPSHMTFAEASTLPAVTATAVMCLVQVAKMTKDDTILIHTGSGGVGIVAIQIAQHIGATVVTTAGSKRKRAFLRNMGVKHVFHSRNTSYEKGIRKALNGGGVDIVLNSLTSAGFKEASIAVCNKGARFVEMSKLNIWTHEEFAALRPDVKYTIVDLTETSEEQMVSLKPLMSDYMENEVIKPLPFVRFDAADVREALMYLQKAKHVGKIVCTMPEPGEGGKLFTPMFNDRSSYLVTGGLGGIGFEVCKWMIQFGAKTVVLVGRNPPNEKTQEEIDRLNASGSNIVVMQADVSDYEQCQKLIETIKQDLPALRGVMHAAGVLTDATYENQTWEKYERTLKPKVNGGWNLHTLTQDCRLEHFVMFSSVVACFGSGGQSNHAAANYYLDSVAHYRNNIGLPATTVNWGQWGQVGVATNIEIAGFRPFSTLQGLYALERALKCQKVQYIVCDMDVARVKLLFIGLKKYFREMKSSGSSEVIEEIQISNEEFWKDFEAAENAEAKTEVLRNFVRILIRQILQLEKDDPLNDDENIQSLGMDSLMMIEMKNSLQSVLGKRVLIPVSVLKDCVTVNQISTGLTKLITKNSDDSSTSQDCENISPEEPISPGKSVESTQL